MEEELGLINPTSQTQNLNQQLGDAPIIHKSLDDYFASRQPQEEPEGFEFGKPLASIDLSDKDRSWFDTYVAGMAAQSNLVSGVALKTIGSIASLIEGAGKELVDGLFLEGDQLSFWDTYSGKFFDDLEKTVQVDFKMPEGYQDMQLTERLIQPEFWLNEGSEGLEFMASFLVPGTQVAKLGKAKAIGTFFKDTATMLSKSKKATQYGQKTADYFSDVMGSSVMSLMEASTEGRHLQHDIENKLYGKYRIEGLNSEEAHAKAKQEANKAAGEVVGNNMLLLMASNTLELGIIGKLLKNSSKTVMGVFKSAMVNGVQEGFEEGMQDGITSYIENKYTKDKEYNSQFGLINAGEELYNNRDNPNTHSAIFLGALLGGGMAGGSGAVGHYGHRQDTNKRKKVIESFLANPTYHTEGENKGKLTEEFHEELINKFRKEKLNEELRAYAEKTNNKDLLEYANIDTVAGLVADYFRTGENEKTIRETIPGILDSLITEEKERELQDYTGVNIDKQSFIDEKMRLVEFAIEAYKQSAESFTGRRNKDGITFETTLRNKFFDQKFGDVVKQQEELKEKAKSEEGLTKEEAKELKSLNKRNRELIYFRAVKTGNNTKVDQVVKDDIKDALERGEDPAELTAKLKEQEKDKGEAYVDSMSNYIGYYSNVLREKETERKTSEHYANNKKKEAEEAAKRQQQESQQTGQQPNQTAQETAQQPKEEASAAPEPAKPKEKVLKVGKVGNTKYEVTDKGVMWEGKEVKNPKELSPIELIKDHITNRKKHSFLSSSVGKEVVVNGVKGKLSKVNHNRYEVEEENRIHEFTFEQIESYSKPENPVQKYQVEVLSETEVTVNGVNYTVNVNKMGNVVSLSPENKPSQEIKNENLLVAVEIERAKIEYSESNEVEDESIVEEIGDSTLGRLLNTIWEFNFTDTIADSLDKLYSGEKLTSKEELQTALWLSDVFDRISKQFNNNPSKRDIEVLLEAYNTAEIINSLLYGLNNLTTNKNGKPKTKAENAKQAESNVSSKRNKTEVKTEARKKRTQEKKVKEAEDLDKELQELENSLQEEEEVAIETPVEKPVTKSTPTETKQPTTTGDSDTTVVDENFLNSKENDFFKGSEIVDFQELADNLVERLREMSGEITEESGFTPNQLAFINEFRDYFMKEGVLKLKGQPQKGQQGPTVEVEQDTILEEDDIDVALFKASQRAKDSKQGTVDTLSSEIAKIEKRRQEEFKGNIVEESLLYSVEVRGKQYEIIEEKYDKNSSRYFLYVLRDDGEYTSTTKEEEKIIEEEGKNKKLLKDVTSEYTDTELLEEINAKYDAELAALEKSKTKETSASEPISDTDWKNFVDNGVASDSIKRQIAEGIKNNSDLSIRQVAILGEFTSEVEDILKSMAAEEIEKTEEEVSTPSLADVNDVRPESRSHFLSFLSRAYNKVYDALGKFAGKVDTADVDMSSPSLKVLSRFDYLPGTKIEFRVVQGDEQYNTPMYALDGTEKLYGDIVKSIENDAQRLRFEKNNQPIKIFKDNEDTGTYVHTSVWMNATTLQEEHIEADKLKLQKLRENILKLAATGNPVVGTIIASEPEVMAGPANLAKNYGDESVELFKPIDEVAPNLEIGVVKPDGKTLIITGKNKNKDLPTPQKDGGPLFKIGDVVTLTLNKSGTPMMHSTRTDIINQEIAEHIITELKTLTADKSTTRDDIFNLLSKFVNVTNSNTLIPEHSEKKDTAKNIHEEISKKRAATEKMEGAKSGLQTSYYVLSNKSLVFGVSNTNSKASSSLNKFIQFGQDSTTKDETYDDLLRLLLQTRHRVGAHANDKFLPGQYKNHEEYLKSFVKTNIREFEITNSKGELEAIHHIQPGIQFELDSEQTPKKDPVQEVKEITSPEKTEQELADEKEIEDLNFLEFDASKTFKEGGKVTILDQNKDCNI